MEAVKLAGLEPANVFGFFEKICSIPHGSKNTKAISDYLVDFAQERGLRYIQDEANNVVIFQNGTCGMENHATVILQDKKLASSTKWIALAWILLTLALSLIP